MITIKTEKEIAIVKEGGKLLKGILKELLQQAKPGVKTQDLDSKADEFIKKIGGTPSFKTVRGYKWATCICVNDEVVHGIPDDTLKDGDVLCIDIGLLYKGLHTDCAWTIQVGSQTPDVHKFLKTGEEALALAVKQAKAGNRVGHISEAIQKTVEGAGYSVVKALVGHGIGRNLHESPQIPGFLDTQINNTPLLSEGMTIAIEVIYNQGKKDVVYKNNDGWTIVTSDGSLSAVFEHTILITKDRPLILTRQPV